MALKTNGPVKKKPVSKAAPKAAAPVKDNSAALISALEAKLAALEAKLAAHEEASKEEHEALKALCAKASSGSNENLIKELRKHFATSRSSKVATYWPKL